MADLAVQSLGLLALWNDAKNASPGGSTQRGVLRVWALSLAIAKQTVCRLFVPLRGGRRLLAGMRRVLAPITAIVAAIMLTTPAAYAGDAPRGFWWGSDSNGPVPSSSVTICPSSKAPWREPNVKRRGCGSYGGYFGEVGGYWSVLGCSATNAWNTTGAGDARANHKTYNIGIGTSAYYFGGGPGMDPNYDGTKSEAYAWGQKQAEKAKSLAAHHSYFDSSILVLDVEDDYPNGVPTGWNEVMVPGSCSKVKSTYINPGVDRATFNGFRHYIVNNSSYWIAAYSSPYEWTSIFGTGSAGSLTGTMEWTADWGQNCINPGPDGWSQGSGSCSSNSANFFGGTTSGSKCAIAWQWAAVNNGDYDQIDRNREYLCT